jgi:hypothetical protein
MSNYRPEGTNLNMDPRVRHALDHSQTIDLTTTGRRTGQARRIEIALHNIGGRWS